MRRVVLEVLYVQEEYVSLTVVVEKDGPYQGTRRASEVVIPCGPGVVE